MNLKNNNSNVCQIFAVWPISYTVWVLNLTEDKKIPKL